MDHSAVLATLSPRRKQFLTQRSNWAGLQRLVGHLAAIVVCAAPLVFGWRFAGAMVVPLGVLIAFLFTLSHECTHSTPFRTPWLNDLVGHVISVPLLLPFNWFRYFHFAHHKFTNDPKRDPELEHGPRPATRSEFLIYLSGWGYWRGMICQIWRNAFGTIDAPYLPPRKHKLIRLEARLLLLCYVGLCLTLLWSWLLIWLWILPVLVGQPVLRLYLLAEHGHCPAVANMLENSRTTFTNRLVRFFAWNMPYHAEHHSHPNVPFYRLPDLHNDLSHHLVTTSPGYRAFGKDYMRRIGK
jgi:fatty acid desaturase